MKVKSRITGLLAAVASISLIAFAMSCTREVVPDSPDLTKIEVTKLPSKLNYIPGEAQAFSDMTVTATYSDNSTKTVTEKCTFTGFDSSKSAASQTITVKYTENDVEKQTTFTVCIVKLLSIEITKEPTKTAYPVGEELDLTGMVVTAKYEKDLQADVASKCTATGFDSSTEVEDQVVTVSYKEDETTLTDTFTVKIVSKMAVKAEFVTHPENKVYEQYDPIPMDDAEIKITYSDGTSKNITKFYPYNNCSFTYDTSTVKDKAPVTIKYDDGISTFELSYDVKVVAGDWSSATEITVDYIKTIGGGLYYLVQKGADYTSNSATGSKYSGNGIFLTYYTGTPNYPAGVYFIKDSKNTGNTSALSIWPINFEIDKTNETATFEPFYLKYMDGETLVRIHVVPDTTVKYKHM